MNLHELQTEAFRIIQKIQDAEGEVTPEVEAELAAIEGSIDDKLEACCAVVKNLNGQIEMFAAEARRISARKKQLEGSLEWLKKWIGSAVSEGGWEKGIHSIKWAKNPPSLGVIDEKLIPIEFISYEPKVETEKIKAELKAGVEVPGCQLIKDKKSLRIK